MSPDDLQTFMLRCFDSRELHDRQTIAAEMKRQDPDCNHRSGTHSKYLKPAKEALDYMEKKNLIFQDEYGWYRKTA